MPKAPPARELKVTTAFLSMLGYSDPTIAKKIHRHVRTIQFWRVKDDWPEIVQEARKRWGARVQSYAYRAIQRGMTKPDGHWYALNVLERMAPDEWAKPTQKVKLQGDPEAPLEVRAYDARLNGALERKALTNGHDRETTPHN